MSSVLSVQRTHELYRGVKLDSPEEFRTQVMASGSGSSASTSGLAAPSTANKDVRLQILQLYKITKPLKTIFGSVRSQYGDCVSKAEVGSAIVVAYNYSPFKLYKIV